MEAIKKISQGMYNQNEHEDPKTKACSTSEKQCLDA
jgi:hypothetical protein